MESAAAKIEREKLQEFRDALLGLMGDCPPCDDIKCESCPIHLTKPYITGPDGRTHSCLYLLVKAARLRPDASICPKCGQPYPEDE